MAKKSSDDVFFNKKPKKVYAFYQLLAIHRQMASPLSFPATNKGVLVSHPKKRTKVESETQETHYSKPSEKWFLDAAAARVHPRNALGVTKIDPFKKRQCFVTLKRLMVHPDGKHFMNAMNGSSNGTLSGRPLMDFETVKWKLEKGLYVTTDQFASDMRILFCNAMMLHHVSHEIRRITMKLSELFEMKWKFLEEKWAAKKENEKKEKPKPKENNVTEVCGSVANKARKKRKLSSVFEFGNEEKKCPNSMGTAPSDEELLIKKALDITPKPKQHFLDTILASQGNLFSCNNDVKLQRKKQREVARVMVQKMERTVFIDDNLNSFKELEKLCGRLLEDCNKVNPLKEMLGLVLKDEFVMMTDFDEEKFLNRDWEEGEIVYFN